MTYASINEMANSSSLLQRITAAAAQEGEASPGAWTQANIWRIVSSPGWDAAWASGTTTRDPEVNPDTGARPSVITDAMILAVVQAILNPPPP